MAHTHWLSPHFEQKTPLHGFRGRYHCRCGSSFDLKYDKEVYGTVLLSRCSVATQKVCLGSFLFISSGPFNCRRPATTTNRTNLFLIVLPFFRVLYGTGAPKLYAFPFLLDGTRTVSARGLDCVDVKLKISCNLFLIKVRHLTRFHKPGREIFPHFVESLCFGLDLGTAQSRL